MTFAAASSCYINLIVRESDNNVKLIALDRVGEMIQRFPKMLDDQVMDLMRVLATPDIEVRVKTLSTAMELVSVRNASDMIAFLKKEINKTQEEDFEKVRSFVSGLWASLT